MKTQTGGVYYTIAGAVLGIIGFGRVITLLRPALDRALAFSCGAPLRQLVAIDRTEVIVAIVAGLLAVVCAEVGSRRTQGVAGVKWISMVGSVLGIFSLFAGVVVAVELFIPVASGCGS